MCEFVCQSLERPEVLLWSMINAYRFVLECPNGHNINLQRKCERESLSETEAMEIFGDEDVSCRKLDCGWQGKASKARLLQIMPFKPFLAL
jgi:hypothetical protein